MYVCVLLIVILRVVIMYDVRYLRKLGCIWWFSLNSPSFCTHFCLILHSIQILTLISASLFTQSIPLVSILLSFALHSIPLSLFFINAITLSLFCLTLHSIFTLISTSLPITLWPMLHSFQFLSFQSCIVLHSFQMSFELFSIHSLSLFCLVLHSFLSICLNLSLYFALQLIRRLSMSAFSFAGDDEQHVDEIIDVLLSY